MTILNGIFNTNFNPAELNVRSFADTMLRLFPNGNAPIWGITAKMGKSRAVSSTHGYFARSLSFVSTTVGAAGALSGDNVIPVASTEGMIKNMVLQNLTTGENVRVLQVVSPTSVSVSRSFGRIAAAGMSSGQKIIAIGTAHEEGSQRPGAKQLKVTYVPNYTQIFRNAWGLTDTARASLAEKNFSNIAENRKDCSVFHSIDMESATIWGQAKMDTSGEQPVHSTQGILDAMAQYVSGNIQTAASTTNYSQLVALVENAFNYSTDMGDSTSRIGFCDRKAMKVLTDIGRNSGQIQIMTSETSFGMRFTSFTFYQGVIHLLQHPMFNGLDPTAGNLLVLDMSGIKLAYMDGRDARPEEYNGQGKNVELGTDGVGGSLTSEFAVECVNPYACVYVKGLTAYG